MSIAMGIIISVIYLYFVFQIGKIQNGKIKDIVCFILMSICTITGSVFSLEYIGTVVAAVILILFDLFYDEESFINQWKWITAFCFGTSILFYLNRFIGFKEKIAVIIEVLLLMYMLLSAYRKMLKAKTNITVIIIYSSFIYLAYSFKENIYGYIILILAICTFIAFESMLSGYNITFKRKTTEFQQDLLMNQYEEIKAVYLNMRGFRHDYHNHIQVIKAHLYMNRLEMVDKYLLELEGELERIDSRIRSGNLMIDAILNSKIAVAEKYNINVTCKAEVPEKLPITDIDLCVVLGNILDNAIESCQKLKENSFIRIYIAVIKKQMYISIQNSAKEDLDFNERNYITNKRGNHGLGMKRVKILVDKYDGYLNLQNEPGIFASEVTLPI